MEIENKLNTNSIDIENNKKEFLNNIIIKTINSAFDIGLRAILPDLIENQVIDIKNNLIENGIKAGINTAVDSIKEFKNSAKGIITGNFENSNQINTAIGNGGIIDTISDLLDTALYKTYNKGKINKNIYNVIKNGKNILLENVTNNIKKEIKNQNNYLDNLRNYIQNWTENYNKNDFEKMSQEYEKIENEMEKIIPIENIINEVKEIKAIHNLIKSNGQNFNITDEEKKLAYNFE